MSNIYPHIYKAGRFFIQIKYNLTTKLSDYVEKVKEKK